MLLGGLDTASFFNMLLICTACHFEGNEKYLDLSVLLSDNLNKSALNFFILYNEQQRHNYLTNYYTSPTCFNTTVSSSKSS